MCIGEATGDTLERHEQVYIGTIAARDFPAHDFDLRRNADGITWAVLNPRGSAPTLLRFTICRIDPVIMVMIEDAHARRQFRSVATIEDAAAFLRDVDAETTAGLDGDHVLH
jgi:hypothetical protein